MRYLLDTNIISDLMRNPDGPVVARVAQVGEDAVCTSIIVTAELRFGAAKKGAKWLTARLEDVLARLEVLSLEAPMDVAYGQLRSRLEGMGKPIGANDMLIAAQCLALDCTLVTDNEREFARIEGLRVENWLRG
ncbi:type II toxin-antitoxin system VapC family toxin [Nitrospirillum sp. BR 11164]|uniref:type II toxin-antitoxin system VapC family toxin n=1 Tax=Nitrospirillum sp. BR 11164 TaxID=3104324 RepID=UPI002AFDEE1C|nr:type II toxin-antitoxin system VapC family toxin [Nitrospirillum sp. BR 11164]MEA1650964.1 type II toxin-antitoxin system VapC family toxin [Nitrospirillum sp. BR 11164]